MAELEAPPSPANSSGGGGGTGSLESDLELLAQHNCAVLQHRHRSSSAAAPQPQSSADSSQAGEQPLPHRQHCAVVYRAGQKQIVRAYAVGAREELSRIMRLLREVDELRSSS